MGKKDIQIELCYSCGLVVNPKWPWLGASPESLAKDNNDVLFVFCTISLSQHICFFGAGMGYFSLSLHLNVALSLAGVGLIILGPIMETLFNQIFFSPSKCFEQTQ